MAVCKGCGEQISFVKMRTGGTMPVEGEEDEAHYLDLREKVLGPQVVLITEDGLILKGREVRPDGGGQTTVVTLVMGRESHFSSCPDAIRFRRTRQVNK